MTGTAKRVLLFVVLLVAGIIRLAPRFDPSAHFPENGEPIRLARHFAFQGEYASPFRLAQTGPSAYISPTVPIFLGFLVRRFGTGAAGAYAYQFAAGTAMAAQLALLPVLTEAMEMSVWPGILAWFIGLLAPLMTFPDGEASYAGLLCVLATLLVWPLFRKPEAGRFHPVLFGLTMGLLLLTSATVFAVLISWVGYAIYRFRSDLLNNGRWIAVLVIIGVLAPWTIRNFAVFHQFIPFRSALGLALANSNNDCAPMGVRQSELNGCYFTQSPNHNPVEAQKARVMGETKYNAEKLRQTVDWIVHHPSRFASLTVQRIYAFWIPYEFTSPWQEMKSLGRRRERLTIYVMTLLSAFGIVMLARSHRPAFLLLASWLVVFPIIYYCAMYEDRYRYPIMWVTLVAGAHFICVAGSRLTHIRSSRADAARGVGASL